MGDEQEQVAEQFRPGSAAGGKDARVVIVGAGFGGLACARKLDRTPLQVLLLDREGHHLFSPLLYQVATALLNPSEIAYPLRTVFRRSRNVRFRQTTVTGVDFQGKLIHVCDGHRIPYDYLVLATGSADNYFGNEAVAKVSMGLKTLEDASRLRNHVLACLERADGEVDPDELRALLTFVVVGGGPTGVEYSGAIGELIHLVAGRDFPNVRRENVRILLVEGRDRLLGALSERLARYAGKVLKQRGIEVRTGTLVKSADERSATFSDGSIVATRTIVWTGGVRPLDPAGEANLGRTRSKRIEVDAQLRIPDMEGAYAIGDIAGAEEDGAELPMLSAPAMQEGRYVARSILADLRGRPMERPFRYLNKGTLATIGRNSAVGQFPGGLEVTGFIGWLAWIFVHIWYLIGFRNRLVAMINWAWNYLRFDRPIRIILQTKPDPIVSMVKGPDGDG